MDYISADFHHLRGLPCVAEAHHGGEERAEPELHQQGAAAGRQRHGGPSLVRLGAVRCVTTPPARLHPLTCLLNNKTLTRG